MTLLRDGKTRQLECEECAATTDVYDAEDFQVMIEAAKDAGWKIGRDARGDYTHKCPDCGDAVGRARAMFGF